MEKGIEIKYIRHGEKPMLSGVGITEDILLKADNTGRQQASHNTSLVTILMIQLP